MIKKHTLSILLCLFSLVLFGVGLGFLSWGNSKQFQSNGDSSITVQLTVKWDANGVSITNRLPSATVKTTVTPQNGQWTTTQSLSKFNKGNPIPSNKKYVFKGWCLTRDDADQRNTTSSIVFSNSNTTVTLYAAWKDTSKTYYKLYFNSSTTSDDKYPTEYAVGDSVKKTETSFTTSGHNVFKGWYADSQYSDSYLTYDRYGSLVSNAYFYDRTNSKQGKFITNGKWDYEGDVRLYICWVKDVFSYILNDEGSLTQVSISYYGKLQAIIPPTKEGWSFNGYYTQKDGKGTQIYYRNGSPTQKAYGDYFSSTGTWMGIDNNLVLYAYYTPNNYATNINVMYDDVERNSSSDIYATFNSYYSYNDTTYSNIIDQQVWEVPYGSTVRISNITNFKAGYTLKDVVGTNVDISRPSDGVYEITVPANESRIDIVLRKADFKITYNPNGGSVDYTTDYIRYGMVFGKTNIYDYSLIPSGNINGGMTLSGNTFSINSSNSSGGTYFGNFFYPYDGEISSNMQYTVVVQSLSGSGWLTFASPYDASTEGLGDPFILQCDRLTSWNAGETKSFVMTSKSSVSSRTEYNYRSYVPIESGKSINTSFRISVFIGRITTSGTFSYAEPGNKPSSNVLPTPTRSGYLFDGWYYGSTKITETSVYNYTQDITLTAHWVETWENHAEEPKGTGTSNDPYLIATSKNLAWMRNQINSTGVSGGTYWKQTADIDMVAYVWVPIGKTSNSFYGIYDGQFFKIKNLKTSSLYTDSNGLFSSVDGGSLGSADAYNVKNVILEGADINGVEETGGIAGRLINGGKVKNCIVKGSISHTGLLQIGGIVGNGVKYNNTNYVDSCVFIGKINSDGAYNGSIVGSCGGTTYIRDCLGIVTNSNDIVPCDFGAYYDSVLYANNRLRNNTSGTFANWIWVRGMSYPLPKGLAHIANGSAGTLTKEEIVANFVLNDISLWTTYVQDFTITNSAYNNMSTISVYTIDGWECLTQEIYVQANTTYTITFDWLHGGYTPLSGYQGLPLQILTTTPTTTPQGGDNASIALAMAYVPTSAGSGTISLTFSTGSYTSLFVNFNFGYIADGSTNTFRLGNFNIVKN